MILCQNLGKFGPVGFKGLGYWIITAWLYWLKFQKNLLIHFFTWEDMAKDRKIQVIY